MPPAISSLEPLGELEEVDAFDASALTPASRSTFSCLTLGKDIVAGFSRFFDGHLRIQDPRDLCLRPAAVERLTAVFPFTCAVVSDAVPVARLSAFTEGVTFAADCSSGVARWYRLGRNLTRCCQKCQS